MNPEIYSYVRAKLQQGENEAQITTSLIAAGWQSDAIEQVFTKIHTESLSDPSNLIDPGKLIQDSFQLIKYYRKPLGVLFAVSAGLVAFFSGIIATIISMSLNRWYGAGLDEASVRANPTLLIQPLIQNLPQILVMASVFFIAEGVVICWGQSLIINFMKKRLESPLPEIKTFIAAGSKSALLMWWSWLLGLLTAIGGFSFFVIPGVIFSIFFAFVPYVVIYEGTSGFAALNASREYTRNRWLPILLRLIIIGIIASLVNSAFGIIASVFDNFIIQSIISSLGLMAMTFIMTIGTALLYENVKNITGPVNSTSDLKTKILYVLAILASFIAIGIAVTLVTASFKSLNGSLSDLSKLNNLEQARSMLEKFYDDNGYYPQDWQELYEDLKEDLPKDPDTNEPFEYKPTENGKNYDLCASKLSILGGDRCTHSARIESIISPTRPWSGTNNEASSPTPTIVSQNPSPIINNDSQRLKDLGAIQDALTKYKEEKGSFPNDLTTLVPAYLNTVPQDPQSSNNYQYTLNSGEDYSICGTFSYTRPDGSHDFCFGPSMHAPLP